MNNIQEDKKRPIGIFDSGLGGLSVLAFAKKILPKENYIYYSDTQNAPYGTKHSSLVKKLTLDSVQKLVDKNIKALLLACNTATSAAVSDLRKKFSIPIIGMEPALKPAANSSASSGKIVLLATEMTLKEKKLQDLVSDLNLHSQLIKIPAPKMVTLIEKRKFDKERAQKIVNYYLENIDMTQVSSIVLGCTHFVFYKNIIKDLVEDNIEILDGNEGTVQHLKRRLKQENLLNNDSANSGTKFMSSGPDISKEIYNKLTSLSYLKN